MRDPITPPSWNQEEKKVPHDEIMGNLSDDSVTQNEQE